MAICISLLCSNVILFRDRRYHVLNLALLMWFLKLFCFVFVEGLNKWMYKWNMHHTFLEVWSFWFAFSEEMFPFETQEGKKCACGYLFFFSRYSLWKFEAAGCLIKRDTQIYSYGDEKRNNEENLKVFSYFVQTCTFEINTWLQQRALKTYSVPKVTWYLHHTKISTLRLSSWKENAGNRIFIIFLQLLLPPSSMLLI